MTEQQELECLEVRREGRNESYARLSEHERKRKAERDKEDRRKRKAREAKEEQQKASMLLQEVGQEGAGRQQLDAWRAGPEGVSSWRRSRRYLPRGGWQGDG